MQNPRHPASSSAWKAANAWFQSEAGQSGPVRSTSVNGMPQPGKHRMPSNDPEETMEWPEGLPLPADTHCPACGCVLGEEAHAADCPELSEDAEMEDEAWDENELRNYPARIVETWDIRDEFDSVRTEIRQVLIVASISFLCVLMLGVAYMIRIGY